MVEMTSLVGWVEERNPTKVVGICCVVEMTSSVRLRFRKEGLVRFISHLDWTRSILRGMARADVPFVYTQGFSPRPKISFGPPLSLGWESETELIEIEVGARLPRPCLMDLSQKINENLPCGLRLIEAVFVNKKGLLNKEIKYVTYSVGLPKDFDKELLEEKLVAAGFSPRSFISQAKACGYGYDYQFSPITGHDYFILKVEVSARMKDVLNEISEPLGEFSIFVKRLAFYDKDWNRI
ncbi:MAG: TIGR03936 family radical SAM-associated protein [bacterium]